MVGGTPPPCLGKNKLFPVFFVKASLLQPYFNLTRRNMEDDLNFFLIEDDLNFVLGNLGS